MVTIQELLEKAAGMKGSDLHLSVGAPPKVRIFGELINIDGPRLTPEDMHALVYSILPAKLVPRFEEQGEVDFSYSIPSIGRYRANLYLQRGSLAMTIRLVGEQIPTAQELGIPEAVTDLIHRRRGLVLVTGPTASGKTSTLASLIDLINSTYAYSIITLEDPVEYLHPHKKSIVNQREIGTDTKSYSTALTSALRDNPDVIVIGEMRDTETISTALTAAETGHLVFSTSHTLGATNTIDRIIDAFAPYQQAQVRSQLATVIEGIVSQQLIPIAGNLERKAAFEVMLANPSIRTMIREGKTHQIGGVMQANKREGMQIMDDALFELYVNHFIDREQAIGYAMDPVALGARMFV